MKLAILGSPVAHSLSPMMHEAALRHAGLEGEYRAVDVDPEGFVTATEELRAGLLDGANVTMPYKVAGFEVCDEVTKQAHRVGAVNTLYVRDGVLKGDNTDVRGIEVAWSACGLPEDGPVIILGAGGASAAAQLALEGREQYVVARRPAAAETVVNRVETGAIVVEWGAPVPNGVVVNATSIGMHGEVLPGFLLEAATGLFDMPYANRATPSTVLIGERGLPVADGLEMLVGQAVGSFTIWTGVNVEGDVLREAAQQELARRVARTRR